MKSVEPLTLTCSRITYRVNISTPPKNLLRDHFIFHLFQLMFLDLRRTETQSIYNTKNGKSPWLASKPLRKRERVTFSVESENFVITQKSESLALRQDMDPDPIANSRK